MRVLIIIISVLCYIGLVAQSPVSSKATAMGEAAVAFTDPNSLFFNQAGVADLENFSAILSTERRFFSDALQTYSGGALFPTNAGVFGLSINYFGFSEFNQQKVGLVYARKLFDKLRIGAEANFHNYSIRELGNIGLFSFELGLQYELSDEIVIGVQAANPIQQELVEDENLASRLKFGLAYRVSEKLFLSAETEKEIDTPFRIKAGVEYRLIDAIYLRAGWGTAPTLLNFGLGVHISERFQIDVSSSYHQQLGFSPGFSVVFQ